MHLKDKNFTKGFLAGALVCTLTAGGLAMTGCLGGKGNAASSSGESAASVSQAGESESSGTSTSTIDGVDITGDSEEINGKIKKIQSVLDKYYIGNGEDVSKEDLEEGIYKGYVESLGEPYTVYYTKKEYDQLMESTSGQYSGIGVIVSQNTTTGAVTVVRPFEGSPGAEAGILKDDIIYKVDGKEATGADLNEVVSWIKGKEGTTVEIEVYRSSDNQYHTLKVKRRQIDVPMVDHQMLDDKIGYVALYEFESTTADQFDKAVDDLTAQGMKGLVIDLRDNPGGLIDSAQAVLDRILPKDKLLVYTVDKAGKKEELDSQDDEKVDVPITVLVNGNSASASEIVSGCLQDYGKAKLVGTTTYGKGIVQYVLPLGDGSAVKVTGAKYYTPKGRNIHGTGIEPDVKAEARISTGSKASSAASGSVTDESESSASSSGDRYGGQTITDPSSDSQLQKGLDVLKDQIDQ